MAKIAHFIEFLEDPQSGPTPRRYFSTRLNPGKRQNLFNFCSLFSIIFKTRCGFRHGKAL
jgi:hypothetical protein